MNVKYYGNGKPHSSFDFVHHCMDVHKYCIARDIHSRWFHYWQVKILVDVEKTFWQAHTIFNLLGMARPFGSTRGRPVPGSRGTGRGGPRGRGAPAGRGRVAPRPLSYPVEEEYVSSLILQTPPSSTTRRKRNQFKCNGTDWDCVLGSLLYVCVLVWIIASFLLGKVYLRLFSCCVNSNFGWVSALWNWWTTSSKHCTYR